MNAPDLSQTRVLLVDDSKYFRLILRTILLGIGIREICESGDGAEAFAILKEDPFDLVFLDLKMPVIDGLEFIDLVRRAPDTPARDIPIVVVSADGRRESVETAVERGASDFLVKPVRPVDVYCRVASLAPRPEGRFAI